MQELQRPCEGHSAACTLEAHGVGADLTTLVHNIPTHEPFGSFGSICGTGGVVVLVRKSLLRTADSHCSLVLAAGRCLLLNIHFGDLVLQVISVHIEHNASLEDKKLLIRSTKASMVDSAAGISFAAGLWGGEVTG